MVDTVARRMPRLPEAPWLEAAPPALRIAFHGQRPARAAAAPIWGMAFPEEACRANAQGTRASLWLGPDEYLLLDFSADAPQPGAWHPAAVEALEQGLAGIPHALVDISHRQFAFEVHGPHATDILNGACALDLDLATFPIGMCTRTVLAKADIVLWRTRAAAFHLEVWRSFAGYVSGVLGEIAAEFHPPR